MKAKGITLVLVLSVLFAAVDTTYACNLWPRARLSVYPQYVLITDANVTLDGSASYDSDGYITKYQWDWDYDPNVGFDNDYWETSSHYPDGAFDGITTHVYEEAGTYSVLLKVTDNGGAGGPGSDFSYVRTVYVNVIINVPADVNTIQGAIDISSDGVTTVVVSQGTYYENINFNPNDITVTSTDPNNPHIVAATIIDANDSGTVVTFDSGDANSTLRGFTITGGERGVSCEGSSPTISRCVIIENKSGI